MIQAISLLLIAFLIFQMLKKYKLSIEYSGPFYEDDIDDKEIVNEKVFWQIVSDNYSSNYNTHIRNISEELRDLTNMDLQIFQNTMDLLMARSYTSELWNRVYCINLGCSDDCFKYFRTWMISQGKDIFYNTMKDPDYIKYFGRKELLQNYEGFGYVAYEIADQRGLTLVRNSLVAPYELQTPENITSIGIGGIFLSLITWFN